MTPHTRLGRSIIINMPMAIQNSAKPHTFFIVFAPVRPVGISYAGIRLFIPFTYTSSSESKMSITSSSVIFSSFPEVNLSTTSGTMSRIFVIVS